MTNVLAAATFAVFVGLAVAAAITQRRAIVNLLIAFILGVTLVVGAWPINLWPFADWPLIAAYHPTGVTHAGLSAVDAAGVEHPVDARALGSLSYIELAAWLNSGFLGLDAAQKRASFEYLLERLERARARAAITGSMSSRPLASPYFILTPRWWDGAGLPRQRLVGLRLYRDSWDIDQRARDPLAVRRTIVYEYRRSNSR